MRFHLIGIGGAGMSPIAEVLYHRGYAVQGSDQQQSAGVEYLQGMGITVFIGQQAENIRGATHVVVSTAIKGDNPELLAAREQGLTIWHRSEALWFAAGSDRFVAVAGSHGKTTTSGMMTRMLQAAGVDPSFAVGSPIAPHPSGGRAGSDPIFIAEADESDGSFLNYFPAVSLITNIEPDHLDHYGSAAAMEEAFQKFAAQSQQLIICHDDPLAFMVAQQQRAAGGNVLTYGRDPQADIRLLAEQLEPTGSTANLQYREQVFTLKLPVAGAHNLLNAAGAWATGIALGYDGAALASGLATFTGTDRRFSLRGEVRGVRVYDDYAHHPTEITALIQTARQAAGSGQVILWFQPHLYSRTVNFSAEFAAALQAADYVVLAPIFAAREKPNDAITSQVITQHSPELEYIPQTEEALNRLTARARSGDVIVTVGAGSITHQTPALLEALQAS